MNFAEKLTALRKERGWSQEDLAQRLNVSRQTVSKWETGQTTPEMGKLISISDLFQVSLDKLLKNTGAKGPEGEPAEQHPPYPAYQYHRYEYKSQRTLWGLPLVHINIGFPMKRAKGIVAIGNIATGIFSLGLISFGLVSWGALSLGLLALGGAALGGVSCGGLSVGIFAIGGCAIGMLAFGGFAIGIYAVGGGAMASRIALGGFASAHIAIGDTTTGVIQFITSQPIHADDIRQAILQVYPNTWDWLIRLFSTFH